MGPTVALTIVSLKMFFRNRQAVFFSFTMPFIIMVIFGVLNFDAFSEVDIGIVDEAQNPLSKGLVQALEGNPALDLHYGTRDEAIRLLEEGKLDFLAILPAGFDASLDSAPDSAKVEGLFNANRPQEAQVGATILSRALDDLTFQISGNDRLFELESREVNSRSFKYVDFLVPGIIAMAIMQTGIFGVAFALIQLRQQGVLRRLRAARVHPGHFLVGQILCRLVVSIVQTLILIGVGVLMLGVDIRGSLVTLIVLSLIGGGLFISIGYAVSGFARSEESAAPIANLIALPMMFMSGVFFSRDSLPAVLQQITEYLPLTYLANSMRQVTTEGSGLLDVSGDLLGLAAWTIACFFLAVRVFRWE